MQVAQIMAWLLLWLTHQVPHTMPENGCFPFFLFGPWWMQKLKLWDLIQQNIDQINKFMIKSIMLSL